MTKSLQKDVQLLMKILQYQTKINQVIKDFNCNEQNLEKCDYAFDLCALYMSQIGEAAKLLTDESKEQFQYLDINVTKYFRNMIDHVYEKVNKAYLKAYIFSTASKEAMDEVKKRVQYCSGSMKP